MKLAKLAAAFLVTWKVSGQAGGPCSANTQPDPMLGFCVQPINMVRQKQFENKAIADQAAKDLKAFRNPSFTISDVHVYSEEGAK
jgi:hypothetical protein